MTNDIKLYVVDSTHLFDDAIVERCARRLEELADDLESSEITIEGELVGDGARWVDMIRDSIIELAMDRRAMVRDGKMPELMPGFGSKTRELPGPR